MEHTFCSHCGASLTLKDYVARQVAAELAASLKDREMLETESAIRVFERALGWFKIIALVATALLTIVGLGLFWRVSDFQSSVSATEHAVQATADNAQHKIRQSSTESLEKINAASAAAQDASSAASGTVRKQVANVQRTATDVAATIQNEGDSVRKEVSDARSQLKYASELRPQMDSIQRQLNQAMVQVREQQKTLSSSEEFAKRVFSEHVFYTFTIKKDPATGRLAEYTPGRRYPAPHLIGINIKGTKQWIVYLLVPYTPIDGTLQMQYQYEVVPTDAYFFVHNLIVSFWSDTPVALSEHPLVVSYFPDKTDKEVIKAISVRDGRVFADDQPLPKFRGKDPEFKGDKWFPAKPPAKPQGRSVSNGESLRVGPRVLEKQTGPP